MQGNTSEEICEAVLEYESRLFEIHQLTSEEDQQQNIFWSIMKESPNYPKTRNKIGIRIGDHFLNTNPDFFWSHLNSFDGSWLAQDLKFQISDTKNYSYR